MSVKKECVAKEEEGACGGKTMRARNLEEEESRD